MIRTLRRKFIVTAMIAVTLLLLLILGGINVFNAYTSHQESERLLEMLSEPFAMGPSRPAERFNDERGFLERPMNEDSRFSAVYFTARLDKDGELSELDLSHIRSLSEEEAEALVISVDPTSQQGNAGSFRYRRTEYPEGTGSTLVFLELSQQRYDLLRVGVLSLLAFAAGWGLMLLFVMFLSKKAIEPVAESMEKQKRFITDAGHELKTPLAIIRANTEALELRQGESKYSRNILDQAERLSRLTGALLTLARADEALPPADFEQVELSALAQETLHSFSAAAELKGIALDVRCGETVTVKANRPLMTQLISILCDNAVKYCPEGGRITLTVKKEGRALLRLKNTVAEKSADPERFFDRFYRGDSARNQKNSGFGIGLSSARAIAEQQGAKLSAAYEGNELVFTLKL